MNRQYIEQEKRYRKKINELAPTIYAAFCIALKKEYKFGYERTYRILAMTQEIWHEAAVNGLDIVAKCEEETGIDLMSELKAKEQGIDGERI